MLWNLNISINCIYFPQQERTVPTCREFCIIDMTLQNFYFLYHQNHCHKLLLFQTLPVFLTLTSSSRSDTSSNLVSSNEVDLRNLQTNEEKKMWPGKYSQVTVPNGTSPFVCFEFFKQQNKGKRLPLNPEILTRHWNSFSLCFTQTQATRR